MSPAFYDIRIRNDSNEKQSMFLNGAPQNADTKVKFLRKHKNITNRVLSEDGKRFEGTPAGDFSPLVRMGVLAVTYLGSPEYGFAFGRNASYVPPMFCRGDNVLGGVQEP